jgi:hypothetical protein
MNSGGGGRDNGFGVEKNSVRRALVNSFSGGKWDENSSFRMTF